MNNSALVECGLVFLDSLSKEKCDEYNFSNDTRSQLDSYLSNKVNIVSMDVYINCMNIGLGPHKSMALAKRFCNNKFNELYHIDDSELLKCPGIGIKTVEVIREFTKPIVKVNTTYNDGRIDLMDTLLPTKVVNTLESFGIRYADELRYTYLYEDLNCCYKGIISGFYDAYLQYLNKLTPSNYIHKVFEVIILRYRNALNNFCRHNFKKGDSSFMYTRYFCVSYVNELITRVKFNTYGAFEYFNGDTDYSVRKMNETFRYLKGIEAYEESKKILDECSKVMHLLEKYIAYN